MAWLPSAMLTHMSGGDDGAAPGGACMALAAACKDSSPEGKSLCHSARLEIMCRTSMKKEEESDRPRCSLMVRCTSAFPPSLKSSAINSFTASILSSSEMPFAMRSRQRAVTPHWLRSTWTLCALWSSSAPPSSSRSSMLIPHLTSIMFRKTWSIQIVVRVALGLRSLEPVWSPALMVAYTCLTSRCTRYSRRRSPFSGLSLISGKLRISEVTENMSASIRACSSSSSSSSPTNASNRFITVNPAPPPAMDEWSRDPSNCEAEEPSAGRLSSLESLHSCPAVHARRAASRFFRNLPISSGVRPLGRCQVEGSASLKRSSGKCFECSKIEMTESTDSTKKPSVKKRPPTSTRSRAPSTIRRIRAVVTARASLEDSSPKPGSSSWSSSSSSSPIELLRELLSAA
mmetsp:Transcript_12178/g.28540  ORF Transcript_12178/g.28540 Transcript_12178/m.28540 type:complete len:402 (-) Transcript_12178:2802-4007(-)